MLGFRRRFFMRMWVCLLGRLGRRVRPGLRERPEPRVLLGLLARKVIPANLGL